MAATPAHCPGYRPTALRTPGGRSPWLHGCADHEPGVVVDAGHHLDLAAVGQPDPTHHLTPALRESSSSRIHGVPQGVPVHPQMPGQRRNRGVVMGQRVDRPADGTAGELGPRPDQRVGLGERLDRKGRLGAPPRPACATPPRSGRRSTARHGPGGLADRALPRPPHRSGNRRRHDRTRP